MNRDFKNLPKITGKEKQIQRTGKEGTVITLLGFLFFSLKDSAEKKGLCSP